MIWIDGTRERLDKLSLGRQSTVTDILGKQDSLHLDFNNYFWWRIRIKDWKQIWQYRIGSVSWIILEISSLDIAKDFWYSDIEQDLTRTQLYLKRMYGK